MTSRDAFNDSISVMAVAFPVGTNPNAVPRNAPGLGVQFKDKQLQALIMTPFVIADDWPMVRVRFDEGTPKTIVAMRAPTMRLLIFTDGKPIATALKDAHTMLVGINAYRTGEEQIKFAVDGFDAAYKRMKEICPEMP